MGKRGASTMRTMVGSNKKPGKHWVSVPKAQKSKPKKIPAPNHNQKEEMISYMERHTNFAKGRVDGKNAAQLFDNMCQHLSKKLNKLAEPGHERDRDAKKWWKCWTDMRGNARLLAAANRAPKTLKTGGGGPIDDSIKSLKSINESDGPDVTSDCEWTSGIVWVDRIMAVIGWHSALGLKTKDDLDSSNEEDEVNSISEKDKSQGPGKLPHCWNESNSMIECSTPKKVKTVVKRERETSKPTAVKRNSQGFVKKNSDEVICVNASDDGDLLSPGRENVIVKGEPLDLANDIYNQSTFLPYAATDHDSQSLYVFPESAKEITSQVELKQKTLSLSDNNLVVEKAGVLEHHTQCCAKEITSKLEELSLAVKMNTASLDALMTFFKENACFVQNVSINASGTEVGNILEVNNNVVT